MAGGIKVKICGITSVEDALAAGDAGADAVGLNFVGGPRRIADPATAVAIVDALPEGVWPVVLAERGLAGVPPPVNDLVHRGRVRHLQLYGAWTGGTLSALRSAGVEPIVVHHVTDDRFTDQALQLVAQWRGVSPWAVLLDTAGGAVAGGTGAAFDWHTVRRARLRGDLGDWPPILLAGGLNPQNVRSAIEIVAPWGVDVSSGVEAEPGRKDPALMHAFVKAARGAVT